MPQNAWLLMVMVTMNTLLTMANADGRWYNFRLLRNPGLSQSSATSAQDCLNQCLPSSGCSGISYQASSGICLISGCNNLDLYANEGWNTYVLASPFIERKSVLAPQFEWMLTDTCGNTNQGVTNGPNINISPPNYSPSQSVSAGNSSLFTASTTSAISDSDTKLNNPMGQTSLTVMMWVKWSTVQTRSTFMEFRDSSTYGINFLLANGGLFYDITVATTGCSGNCALNSYSLSVVANVWYHVAYSYDGSAGTLKTYLNSTLVSLYSVGTVTNQKSWTKVALINPSDTPLIGNVYCFKILNVTLQATDVYALAQSCYFGKIRLSG